MHAHRAEIHGITGKGISSLHGTASWDLRACIHAYN